MTSGAPSCLYVPGRNEANAAKTGALLRDMGLRVRGPDLTASQLRLGFAEQIDAVLAHLCSLEPRAPIVAKSYGAYLLLHALLAVGALPHPVLLLCPVMGPGVTRTAGGFVGSLPPRPHKVLNAAESGTFPAPASLEIHIGDRDVCADQARAFAARVVRTSCHIVPDVDHSLGRDRERDILYRFLAQPGR